MTEAVNAGTSLKVARLYSRWLSSMNFRFVENLFS